MEVPVDLHCQLGAFNDKPISTDNSIYIQFLSYTYISIYIIYNIDLNLHLNKYMYIYIASSMGNSWGIHPDKVAREYHAGETSCFLFGRSQSACPNNYHVRFSI